MREAAVWHEGESMPYPDLIKAHFGMVGGELIGRGEVRPEQGSGSYAEGPVFWEVCIGGAEVEVDPETGRVTVRKAVSVADVGKAINPRLVEAQEMGGVMQGIGNALHEEMLFDATGTLLNAHALRLPRPDDRGPAGYFRLEHRRERRRPRPLRRQGRRRRRAGRGDGGHRHRPRRRRGPDRRAAGHAGARLAGAGRRARTMASRSGERTEEVRDGDEGLSARQRHADARPVVRHLEPRPGDRIPLPGLRDLRRPPGRQGPDRHRVRQGLGRARCSRSRNRSRARTRRSSSQLAKIGVRPEEIDIVVNSHLHFDHCSGNKLLPAAPRSSCPSRSCATPSCPTPGSGSATTATSSTCPGHEDRAARSGPLRIRSRAGDHPDRDARALRGAPLGRSSARRRHAADGLPDRRRLHPAQPRGQGADGSAHRPGGAARLDDPHREHRPEDRRQDLLLARSRRVRDLQEGAGVLRRVSGATDRDDDARRRGTEPKHGSSREPGLRDRASSRLPAIAACDPSSPITRSSRCAASRKRFGPVAGQRPRLARPLAGRDPRRPRRERRRQDDADEHPRRDVPARCRDDPRSRGEEVPIASPADALRRGIGTVYQHFTLVPNLSILENVVLGAEGGFVLDLGDAEARLAAMLADFGLDVSPRTEIRHLALGQRQRVEIIKVLFRGSRVLLLDEPTSVLTPGEVDVAPRAPAPPARPGRRRRPHHPQARGGARGQRPGHDPAQGRNVGELGPDVMSGAHRESVRAAHRRADVRRLPPTRRSRAVTRGHADEGDSRHPAASEEPSSLTLGMTRGWRLAHATSQPPTRSSPCATSRRWATAALRRCTISRSSCTAARSSASPGSTATARRSWARSSPGSGRSPPARCSSTGVDITNRGVAAATRLGHRLRHRRPPRRGLASPGASVADNVVLKSIGRKPFSNGFWLNRRAMDEQARRLIAEFDVKTPGPRHRDRHALRRQHPEAAAGPRAGARPEACSSATNRRTGSTCAPPAFVARSRCASRPTPARSVLLISSELDELLEISDRIGVMYNGQLVAVMPARRGRSRRRSAHLMLGGRETARDG